MIQSDHAKLICEVAKEYLAPLGFVQKGKSRLWFHDQGWYLILVEFQPSSWNKGSYVNVGINLLWTERDNFAFNEGKRIGKFLKFETEAHFSHMMQNTMRQLTREIRKYHNLKRSTDKIANLFGKSQPENIWNLYHTGVAYGISDNSKKAAIFLNKLIEQPNQIAWQKQVEQQTVKLLKLLPDSDEFQQAVIKIILNTRFKLGLPDWNDPFF